MAFTSALNGWAVGESGLLRTTNGGVSWAPAHRRTPHPFRHRLLLPQQGWLAGRQGAAWTTTDGGTTWTNAPTNQTQNIAGLAVPADGDVWTAGAGHLILHKQGNGPFSVAAPPRPHPLTPTSLVSSASMRSMPTPSTSWVVMPRSSSRPTAASVGVCSPALPSR
ncbi:MAG: hypothetical protein HZY76_08735 [Anaerolineae bacterium]|nr:MAG: hypothetical protein HZY76_08735 [Anaerolineae bacterium]